MAEKILRTEYSEEMQRSYMNYSMSVITARAIPDARDGLKPVQRRVLYDMRELHLDHDKPHRKSARIVGDTMGKYHPHGDSSIYETLVVMSQNFKKGMAWWTDTATSAPSTATPRPPTVTPRPACPRISDEMLRDIEKDTVDWDPNFDESRKEPRVLPSRFPNLLVNGSTGIAVGMATNIPPHNLTEVIEARWP